MFVWRASFGLRPAASSCPCGEWEKRFDFQLLSAAIPLDCLDVYKRQEHNIPRTFHRGKTYWSKKHIDDYFAKKAPDPEIKEWYSTQNMQEKFGMTLTAIYSFVSKNAIPKKKVGIMVYYSKKHVDIAKGLIVPEEPKYYTIAEAMERFNLTRDQLYHYVKYHNIPRIKVGKYTKILRAEMCIRDRSKPDKDYYFSTTILAICTITSVAFSIDCMGTNS